MKVEQMKLLKVLVLQLLSPLSADVLVTVSAVLDLPFKPTEA